MDRTKAMDDRSKKREVTKATDVTEATESKARTKATTAIKTTQTNSAIFKTRRFVKEEREGTSAILDSKRKEQRLD